MSQDIPPLLPGKLVMLYTHFIKPARCEIVKWLFRVGAVLTQHVSLMYRKPEAGRLPLVIGPVQIQLQHGILRRF